MTWKFSGKIRTCIHSLKRRVDGSFSAIPRCVFLKYTKYSRENAPCLAKKSLAHPAYSAVNTGSKGADPHRARYHSSVIDIENLDARQDFSKLPDTYTIFITEKDFFGKGEPVYFVERINITTGEPFADGEHILYVNGEYRGTSDIGKLMHDFSCTDADDMNFELMAERTRYLKENPKGVNEMCKVIEDMRTQERKETMTEIALRMLRAGRYALEEIVNISGLSLDEVKNLQIGHNA